MRILYHGDVDSRIYFEKPSFTVTTEHLISGNSTLMLTNTSGGIDTVMEVMQV